MRNAYMVRHTWCRRWKLRVDVSVARSTANLTGSTGHRIAVAKFKAKAAALPNRVRNHLISLTGASATPGQSSLASLKTSHIRLSSPHLWNCSVRHPCSGKPTPFSFFFSTSSDGSFTRSAVRPHPFVSNPRRRFAESPQVSPGLPFLHAACQSSTATHILRQPPATLHVYYRRR